MGPGTMMGDVFRRYWLPMLLSAELPEPDCPPVRVRMLGEDLIAFRQTDGHVGLVGEPTARTAAPRCSSAATRRTGCAASTTAGSSTSTGHCVDMPNEPAESNFKSKVQHHGLSVPRAQRRHLGLHGPAAGVPELPDLEWNTLPASKVYMSKRYQECNWAQALEGGIDSTHSAFLHSRPGGGRNVLGGNARETRGMNIRMKEKHAHFECLETPYGVLVAARRNADEDNYYWRITQFLMPSYTMIPPYGLGSIGGHIWVPMDDHTTMAWSFTWQPLRDLTDDERDGLRTEFGHPPESRQAAAGHIPTRRQLDAASQRA